MCLSMLVFSWRLGCQCSCVSCERLKTIYYVHDLRGSPNVDLPNMMWAWPSMNMKYGVFTKRFSMSMWPKLGSRDVNKLSIKCDPNQESCRLPSRMVGGRLIPSLSITYLRRHSWRRACGFQYDVAVHLYDGKS